MYDRLETILYSINHSKFVFNKITGRWIIQQLPWPFPQCCRQPTLNFEEEIVDPKKASNETQPIWIRMTVDFPSCKNEQETWQQPLSWRLLQNRINEGIFLVKLPWPLGMKLIRNMICLLETNFCQSVRCCWCGYAEFRFDRL